MLPQIYKGEFIIPLEFFKAKIKVLKKNQNENTRGIVIERNHVKYCNNETFIQYDIANNDLDSRHDRLAFDFYALKQIFKRTPKKDVKFVYGLFGDTITLSFEYNNEWVTYDFECFVNRNLKAFNAFDDAKVSYTEDKENLSELYLALNEKDIVCNFEIHRDSLVLSIGCVEIASYELKSICDSKILGFSKNDVFDSLLKTEYKVGVEENRDNPNVFFRFGNLLLVFNAIIL